MSVTPDTSNNVGPETVLQRTEHAAQNTKRDHGVPHGSRYSTARSWRQRLASMFYGAFLGVVIPTLAFGQATLLPNAKQQYTNDAGVPLTGGSVTYFVPGQATKKTIWLNSTKTTPSTNPVFLDAAGRPQPTGQTFGDGQYRQQVKDIDGNVIWDAVTASTGSSGGGGGGTLIGDGAAVGTIIAWAGLVAPTNYVFTFGQAISRASFPALFAAITFPTSVICTSGLNVLSGITDTTQIKIGAPVEASCVAPGTTVSSVATTSVTVSNNASVSTAVTATFFPWDNGDGSTTFNVPDLRGRVLPGRNNMGSTAAPTLTPTFYGTGPNALGAAGGTQSATLATTNLPAQTPSGTIINGAITVNGTASNNTGTATFVIASGGGIGNYGVASLSVTQVSSTFNGTPFAGQIATPLSVIQPSTTVNYAIKIIPDTNISLASCLQLADAGTACLANTGTSGHTIPFLDGTNTWGAGLQTIPQVAIGGGTITGMPNPVAASDVANKSYVDSLATGLNLLPASGLATAAVLPNTPTYNNGASGVGATLTAGTNSTLTVDGTVAILGTVVLVKNQAAPAQNGIYTVTTAGSGSAAWVLTRATYFDQAAEMKSGSYTLITGGSTNINSSWTLQTAVTTVGTDPSNWAQFSAACSVFNTAAVGCVPATGAALGTAQLTVNATWVTPPALLVQSRTAAALLNLTGVNTLRTLGWANGGDGGGAVFVPAGSAPFKDSYITTAAIVGGSGYVNGTYNNIPLGGSTGLGCQGQVVVSGGAVTAVNISIPCAAYAVSDVLSTNNSFLGGGTGFTYTVLTISTAMGSFTDTVGNRMQIVVDEGNWPNVRQFGAKLDWNGNDGAATNDRPSYMSAMAFVLVPFSAAAADINGTTIIVPKGASLLCGGSNGATLPVPQGVTLRGSGMFGATTLKQCTAETSANNFIQLCDIYTDLGQIGCALKDITLIADGPTNANIAAISSISGQQFPLIDNVWIQPGLRACIFYDFGKGGAANAIFQNFDCEGEGTSNSRIVVGSHVGGTQMVFRNFVMECSTQCNTIGMSVNGGNLVVDTVNIEGIQTGFNVNNTLPSVIRNVTPGAGCTALVQLSAANPNGKTLLENLTAGSCTQTVANGHPGGPPVIGDLVGQRTFSP